MSKKEKKKAGLGTWLYRLVMIALLCVMIFSGYKVFTIYMEYHKGTVAYDDLAKIAGAGESADKEEKDLTIDWDALTKISKNVKGWIRSKGTVINYPIMQGSDNDYYLYHIMTGEYSRKGSIFIDCNNRDPFNSFLTIVYGHRMLDDSMFNSLGNYFEDAKYYKKHKVIDIYTPEKNYKLEIFGAANVNATNESIYNLNIAEDDVSTKEAYINNVLSKNELAGYKGTVDVTANDKIVMLSTCTYDPGDDRIVVWGKLVEKTPESK